MRRLARPLLLLLLLVAGCADGPAAERGPLGLSVDRAGGVERIHGRGLQLDLAGTPLPAWFGLPAVGTLTIELEAWMPDGDPGGAVGAVVARCDGCIVGPGDVPVLGGTVAIEPLAADASATIAIAGGRARVVGWRWSSADLEVVVAMTVELAAEVDGWRWHGCVHVHPTAALRARAPRTATWLDLATGPDPDAGLVVERDARGLRITHGGCAVDR